jgi:hypothetical protein
VLSDEWEQQHEELARHHEQDAHKIYNTTEYQNHSFPNLKDDTQLSQQRRNYNAPVERPSYKANTENIDLSSLGKALSGIPVPPHGWSNKNSTSFNSYNEHQSLFNFPISPDQSSIWSNSIPIVPASQQSHYQNLLQQQNMALLTQNQGMGYLSQQNQHQSSPYGIEVSSINGSSLEAKRISGVMSLEELEARLTSNNISTNNNSSINYNVNNINNIAVKTTTNSINNNTPPGIPNIVYNDKTQSNISNPISNFFSNELHTPTFMYQQPVGFFTSHPEYAYLYASQIQNTLTPPMFPQVNGTGAKVASSGVQVGSLSNAANIKSNNSINGPKIINNQVPSLPSPLEYQQQQTETMVAMAHKLYKEHKDTDNSDHANLMNTEEIDNIIRLQMSQVQSDNPYVDDFYYQVLVRKKIEFDGKNGNTLPTQMKTRFDSLVLHSLSFQRPTTQTNPQLFSGILGRPPHHSVRSPRPLLRIQSNEGFDNNINNITGNNIEENYDENSILSPTASLRNTRLTVENAFNCLMEIEDIDKVLHGLPPVYYNVDELLRQKEALFAKFYKILVRSPPEYNSSVEDLFAEILLLPKGHRLIARALSMLPANYNHSFLLIYIQIRSFFIN